MAASKRRRSGIARKNRASTEPAARNVLLPLAFTRSGAASMWKHSVILLRRGRSRQYDHETDEGCDRQSDQRRHEWRLSQIFAVSSPTAATRSANRSPRAVHALRHRAAG